MKKFIKQFFLITLSISLMFLAYVFKVQAISDVDWKLILENNDGKQWIDLGSLKKFKNDEISVLTKYFKNPNETNKNGETFLYVMKINCETAKYKDISVNGVYQFRAKWKSSNNDELIDRVIESTCTYRDI